MKSVLITGATGFIGRHTIIPLLNKNFQIHATFNKTKPLADFDITWHQIDLLEESSIENLLQKTAPTHLLHLAWYMKHQEYWNSPFNLAWVNSSIQLLNAFIKAKGKRAVFVGTCAEYDWKSGLCHEFLTPCNPNSLYGKAKRNLYTQCDEIIHQKNLSFAWARLFFLFGANEYPARLIPSAINNLLNQRKFEVKNGHHIRDFMYVMDVADALASLLDSEVNGPVNIASGQAVLIKDLMSLIADQLGEPKAINLQTSLETPTEVIADISRLRTEVKWQPHHSMNSALEKTISWWRDSLCLV